MRLKFTRIQGKKIEIGERQKHWMEINVCSVQFKYECKSENENPDYSNV